VRANQIDRVKQIRLARPGCSTPNINPSHRPPAANDYGATGERVQVVGVTHLEARNVGKAAAFGTGPSGLTRRIHLRLRASSRNSSHSSRKK
jgi:hypothetical protein